MPSSNLATRPELLGGIVLDVTTVGVTGGREFPDLTSSTQYTARHMFKQTPVRAAPLSDFFDAARFFEDVPHHGKRSVAFNSRLPCSCYSNLRRATKPRDETHPIFPGVLETHVRLSVENMLLRLPDLFLHLLIAGRGRC